MSGADYHEYETGHFATRVYNAFGGIVYEEEHTLVSDAPARFIATELKLRSGVILVSTHDVLLGDLSTQSFPVAAGETISVSDIDLSQLGFKNAIAGNNAKLNVIGVKV